MSESKYEKMCHVFEGECIEQEKIPYLCYLADTDHYEIHGRSLSGTVYRVDCGTLHMEECTNTKTLTKKDIEHIKLTIKEYEQYSLDKLREYVISDSPFCNANPYVDYTDVRKRDTEHSVTAWAE